SKTASPVVSDQAPPKDEYQLESKLASAFDTSVVDEPIIVEEVAVEGEEDKIANEEVDKSDEANEDVDTPNDKDIENSEDA
ncbi:MAG: hypothetical protein AAGK97_11190, partial [Bacteroidota bacterium]